jgi:quercetin dioxygenase-like cupin family protein
LVIDPSQVEVFDRNEGVSTVPYVGKWNSERATITTGVTRFAPGTALALHTHNVEESVLVLEGEAVVEVGDTSIDLVAGEATWVPSGIPHRFINRGAGEMAIYWVYGGREVTRTICATGETFEHLSAQDRGGIRA